MTNKVVAWAEEHPWEIGGVIVFVGLVVIVGSHMGGGSSVPANSAGDASTAAAEQLAAQNSATAAQFALQQETDNTNLAVAALQGQIDFNRDNLSSAVALANLQAQQAVALDSNLTNFRITQNNNDSAVLINSQNNSAQTAQVNIVNQTQAAITKFLSDAQVTTALGADSVNLGIAQVNGATQQAMIQAQASAAKRSSNNSFWGSVLGFVAAIL